MSFQSISHKVGLLFNSSILTINMLFEETIIPTKAWKCVIQNEMTSQYNQFQHQKLMLLYNRKGCLSDTYDQNTPSATQLDWVQRLGLKHEKYCDHFNYGLVMTAACSHMFNLKCREETKREWKKKRLMQYWLTFILTSYGLLTIFLITKRSTGSKGWQEMFSFTWFNLEKM